MQQSEAATVATFSYGEGAMMLSDKQLKWAKEMLDGYNKVCIDHAHKYEDMEMAVSIMNEALEKERLVQHKLQEIRDLLFETVELNEKALGAREKA